MYFVKNGFLYVNKARGFRYFDKYKSYEFSSKLIKSNFYYGIIKINKNVCVNINIYIFLWKNHNIEPSDSKLTTCWS